MSSRTPGHTWTSISKWGLQPKWLKGCYTSPLKCKCSLAVWSEQLRVRIHETTLYERYLRHRNTLCTCVPTYLQCTQTCVEFRVEFHAYTFILMGCVCLFVYLFMFLFILTGTVSTVTWQLVTSWSTRTTLERCMPRLLTLDCPGVFCWNV